LKLKYVTKADIETSKASIRTMFATHYGVKFQDTFLDFLIQKLKDLMYTLEVVEITSQDTTELSFPKDVLTKLNYALKQMPKLIGLKIKDDLCLFAAVFHEGYWLPGLIKEETNGEISSGTVQKINNYFLGLFFAEDTTSYPCKIVGPRGGELSFGKFYSKVKKPTEDLISVIFGDCSLKY
jgi:hypothetical protein